jgi:hypothetical protein
MRRYEGPRTARLARGRPSVRDRSSDVIKRTTRKLPSQMLTLNDARHERHRDRNSARCRGAGTLAIFEGICGRLPERAGMCSARGLG